MRITVFKLFLAFCAAGSLFLYRDYQRFVDEPLNITQETRLDLARGATQSGLLQQWIKNSWLRHPRDRYWLRIHQTLRGEDSMLQAGEYRIRPGQNLLDVLHGLQTGQVLQYAFTIVEGWNFRQLRAALSQEKRLIQKLPELSDAQFMQQLQRAGQHPEGRFLPETYAYSRGSSDIQLLRRAANAMDTLLLREWNKRSANLPLQTAEQALILASIVEKETGKAQERAQIAGVFVERLERGMRLQTDPTVIYGLGEDFDGNLRRQDLRRDTPYNSYTRHGLPPSPIAMPGEASISASLHPHRTGHLYFVSRGDGSHYFSKTLAEHEAAVKRFQLR